jgi:hypothetical protein
MRRLALVVGMGLALLGACKSGGDEGDGTTSGGASSGSSGGASSGSLGGGDAGKPTGECNDATRLIYVITDQSALVSFKPETATFSQVGLIACPSGGATPTSMAVDRNGTAWVRYYDGSLYKVDTKTAACQPTNFVSGQLGFLQFGMGYSTDGVGTSRETLFLSDSLGGKGLATLDTGTLKVSQIGTFDGAVAGRSAELTGTGDGRLYGLFTTSPVTIAEIDKSSGRIKSTAEVADTFSGAAWAFSFYGGDFYVYTAPNAGGLPKDQLGSKVTRYRPSDKSTTVIKAALNFRIVGAGVSTCAPITIQ